MNWYFLYSWSIRRETNNKETKGKTLMRSPARITKIRSEWTISSREKRAQRIKLHEVEGCAALHPRLLGHYAHLSEDYGLIERSKRMSNIAQTTLVRLESWKCLLDSKSVRLDREGERVKELSCSMYVWEVSYSFNREQFVYQQWISSRFWRASLRFNH